MSDCLAPTGQLQHCQVSPERKTRVEMELYGPTTVLSRLIPVDYPVGCPTTLVCHQDIRLDLMFDMEGFGGW
ncbi:unnamed protein product [Aspergillus oryzae]|uniref:Unnamed protein product n=2 Tax=Aspergillus oryzae TaxID=5062 RepID=A0AAN5C2S0_ASPOZ|nr:unnamed protein product [Aspergillus oryzae]GMF86723.1 unnamed protein product [Aspergillus oryzae]GMG14864.1 unnamed protein product [Aspergillus oryzae]GMG35437.1 unnamed protein product [Aspergillus oryzae]GMG45072.1 unnamed protein product [Aspergillus oryzae var. brunneus]